jgi:hypothetical protein
MKNLKKSKDRQETGIKWRKRKRKEGSKERGRNRRK